MAAKDTSVPEVVGPYAWGVLQNAVDTFPCETCSAAGTKFIHGIHDLVNIRLGKPVKFPEDLQWLKGVVDREVHNPRILDSQNPGKVDRCIQEVIKRQCPPGVKRCKVNPSLCARRT